MQFDNKQLIETYHKLDENDSYAADQFFGDGMYFPGNTLDGSHMPHEKFLWYEGILKDLYIDNPKRYLKIHKGTPYYFLGWTAFDLRDYERSIFYFDAALLEDVRRNPRDWKGKPAADFFYLRDKTGQSALRVTIEVRRVVEEKISNYNANYKLDFTLQKFLKYVDFNAEIGGHRSIITSLYSFILDFFDRANQLNLRSIQGGTFEPFFLHLFKGCLVFESVLKEFFKDQFSSPLGSILIDKKVELGIPDFKTQSNLKLLRQIINKFIEYHLKSCPSITQSIFFTYKLRNATGHNLAWDVKFCANTYKELFENILYSIFYLIDKKHL